MHKWKIWKNSYLFHLSVSNAKTFMKTQLRHILCALIGPIGTRE